MEYSFAVAQLEIACLLLFSDATLQALTPLCVCVHVVSALLLTDIAAK